MVFHIISLFPEFFGSVFSSSIIRRAIDKKSIKIRFVNPRDFATDRHKTVDDKPYGGGKGMIMKVDIVVKAIESIKPKPYSVLLSASGKKYTQQEAETFSQKQSLALICGHYEGIDARVEKFTDDVISIGDFVLTGGEIAAATIVDSVTRLIPGVIKEGSTEFESFSKLSTLNSQFSTLLEYPQYTRPEIFRGLKVPQVLLSGNHKEVAAWRQKETLKRTRRFRPDLLTRGS